MTALADVLAEALVECGTLVRHEDDWGIVADTLAEAVAAAGLAVIQLPEQMTDRSNVAEGLRHLPMWEVDGAWTCLGETIEYEADGQSTYGVIGPEAARGLAAALLAAANAAEAVTA